MSTYAQYQFDVVGYQDVIVSVDGTERRAAAELGFLRSKSAVLEEYIMAIQLILRRLAVFETFTDPFLMHRKTGSKVLLFISGEKGLVGDYYTRLFSFGLEKRHEYNKIFCIGEKAKQYLEESGIESEYLASGIEIPEYQEGLTALTQQLEERFLTSDIAQIDILAAKSHTLTIQIPYISQLLPLPFSIEADSKEEQLGSPIFESKKKDIVAKLTPSLFQALLAQIILETTTAEFSARTVAMEQAKEKTRELLRKLRRDYYKSRTLVLTQKQLESFMVHKLI